MIWLKYFIFGLANFLFLALGDHLVRDFVNIFVRDLYYSQLGLNYQCPVCFGVFLYFNIQLIPYHHLSTFLLITVIFTQLSRLQSIYSCPQCRLCQISTIATSKPVSQIIFYSCKIRKLKILINGRKSFFLLQEIKRGNHFLK